MGAAPTWLDLSVTDWRGVIGVKKHLNLISEKSLADVIRANFLAKIYILKKEMGDLFNLIYLKILNLYNYLIRIGLD